METREQQSHNAAHNNATMRAASIEKVLMAENAKLREQLESARDAALSEGIRSGEILKRAEAAEARLKALEEHSRIAELQRKLAQYQSAIVMDGDGEEELNTLLAQAREEGRKEAISDFKIPAYRFNDFCEQVFNQSMDLYDLRLFDYGHLVEAECKKLLAAAPAPKEKP